MCLRQFLDTDRLVAEAKDKTHLQLLGCSHPILEERVIWTGCACWPHSERMLLGEFYLLVLMWHRPFMNRTGDIRVDCLQPVAQDRIAMGLSARQIQRFFCDTRRVMLSILNSW